MTDDGDGDVGLTARAGLSLIYGEHDGQRREEFVLRRVRAGRLRRPVLQHHW